MSRVRLPSPAPLSFGDFKADVAQLVERILGKDEVTSSNLVMGSSCKQANGNNTIISR
jgi:hypothetical protein